MPIVLYFVTFSFYFHSHPLAYILCYFPRREAVLRGWILIFVFEPGTFLVFLTFSAWHIRKWSRQKERRLLFWNLAVSLSMFSPRLKLYLCKQAWQQFSTATKKKVIKKNQQPTGLFWFKTADKVPEIDDSVDCQLRVCFHPFQCMGGGQVNRVPQKTQSAVSWSVPGMRKWGSTFLCPTDTFVF